MASGAKDLSYEGKDDGTWTSSSAGQSDVMELVSVADRDPCAKLKDKYLLRTLLTISLLSKST